ncbi:MAG: DUF4382 domain-containing protein, partial [Bacteroidota bacterium]|nr:DUF4382 domain-containing protein [Bacteroidota bacterium]
FLDIKSVEVLVDTSKNTRQHDSCDWDRVGARNGNADSASLVWNTLNIKAGLYDVVALKNGIDTLLSTSNVFAGNIRLIRIDLGPQSSIVVDSVTHPLYYPTNFYILIKLKGDEWEEYASNSYRLWLDFDVMKSIVVSNGRYYLVPCVRNYVVSKTGRIHGAVAPQIAFPEIIKVYSATDTAYALPNPDGEFTVRGLKDGNYSVYIHSLAYNPLNTQPTTNVYLDSTINNVVIKNANTVNMGVIYLRRK